MWYVLLTLVLMLVSFIGGVMLEMWFEDSSRGVAGGFWYYVENATLGIIEDFLLFRTWRD